jgi:predicted nuclease of predicted toxin-antitoxin system
MRFLLDMNISPVLADALRTDGHDVVHSRELGLGRLPDRDIFGRARVDDRIVVTFDLDFGDIAGTARQGGPGLLLLRLRFASCRSHAGASAKSDRDRERGACRGGSGACRGRPHSYSGHRNGRIDHLSLPMDRIDPEDLLGLFDRLDVEVDHDRLVVAAHQHAFQGLVG